MPITRKISAGRSTAATANLRNIITESVKDSSYNLHLREGDEKQSQFSIDCSVSLVS